MRSMQEQLGVLGTISAFALNTGKPRKTCAEVAGRRTFRTSNETGNIRINVTSRRVPVTAVGVEKQCIF